MRIDGRSLLSAWRLLRTARVDPFAAASPDQLPLLPGWAALGLPSSELASARVVTVLDALRAMTLVLKEPPEARESTQLVATLPTRDSSVLRTRDALRVLITSASKDLLIIGYSITDASFCDLLIRRARAGVRITVVGDRKEGAARNLLRQWPHGLALTALEDVETVEDRHLMHGKVVVVDGAKALVGSANFSSSGLGKNLELGVLVEGKLAGEIVDVVKSLRNQGWLVPAGPAAGRDG